jgi:hypothetical protein
MPAHAMLEYVKEGRAYTSTYYLRNTRTQQQFMQVLQTSPPLTEIHQLEALGGTLYDMLHGVCMGHNGFTAKDLRFLIALCTEYVHIDYLVICILHFIIRTRPGIPERQESILPEIYSFFAFLTKYYDTKKRFEINWSIDIVVAWTGLCYVEDNICTLFCEDRDLIPIFVKLLKTEIRGSLLPYHESIALTSPNDIRIRVSLVTIQGAPINHLCFEYVCPLLHHNINFRQTVGEYWQFILDERGEIHAREYITDILYRIISEESYPKSANKY